jgi:hypothetical protein
MKIALVSSLFVAAAGVSAVIANCPLCPYEQRAEAVEEQLVEVEASVDDPLKAAETATAALTGDVRP